MCTYVPGREQLVRQYEEGKKKLGYLALQKEMECAWSSESVGKTCDK